MLQNLLKAQISNAAFCNTFLKLFSSLVSNSFHMHFKQYYRFDFFYLEGLLIEEIVVGIISYPESEFSRSWKTVLFMNMKLQVWNLF